MDFLRNVFGKIRKGSVSTESTHPAITTPENASRAAPTDDIPKSLAVLENAYLVRHDEDLEKRVKDALDGVSATGEAGINVLLERLYRDMQITGSHLQVQFGGDLAWNEWLKKQRIARALGRAGNIAAVERLGRLIPVKCDVGAFYDFLLPDILDALAEIKGKEASSYLKKAKEKSSIDSENQRLITNKLKALEEISKVVEARDERGRTRLHQAAFEGNVESATKLISQGATVDAHDKYDMTPLFVAAGRGHLEICKLLVQHGADIETVGCVFGSSRMYYTPLLYAIEGECQSTAEELKRKSVAEYLLSVGANPNAKIEPLRANGLHRAAWWGLFEIVKLLVTNGTDVNATDWARQTPLTIALEKGSGIHLTPASRTSYQSIAEFLKKHGGT
jgi:hypothetical protein